MTMEVRYYYGEPGTGKSYAVMKQFPTRNDITGCFCLGEKTLDALKWSFHDIIVLECLGLETPKKQAQLLDILRAWARPGTGYTRRTGIYHPRVVVIEAHVEPAEELKPYITSVHHFIKKWVD